LLFGYAAPPVVDPVAGVVFMALAAPKSWRGICKLSGMIDSVTANRHFRGARAALRAGWGALALMGLWSGPSSAQTSTAAPAAESLATIRAAAQSCVKGLLPPSPGGNTVTVGQLDSRLRLPHCSQALSAALPPGMPLQARMTIGVTCAGANHWTVYVPVTVESTINVLVLSHAVGRDSRLTVADVMTEMHKTAGPGTAYLSSPTELSNRTVRRPLAAGTLLTADMFAPDLIVRRGQEVTLLSSGDLIEVRASGRAMSDGAAGARIQVQNLSSLRVVEGVVETADLVRIAR